MEMSRPSHIFLIVDTVALLFLPLVMLLRVDCVMPQIVESLFTVIFRSSQSVKILCRTASPIVTRTPPTSNSFEIILVYLFLIKKFNSFELTFGKTRVILGLHFNKGILGAQYNEGVKSVRWN